jgi:acetylornithine deacetylase
VGRYRLRIRGVDSHASTPHLGVNAIEWMARAIEVLREGAREWQAHQQAVPAFDPPFSTLSVGTISGGIATNIVPGLAEAEWDLRVAPWDDVRELVTGLRERLEQEVGAKLRALDSRAGLEMEEVVLVPPLRGSGSSGSLRLLQAVLRSDATSTVSFGTEDSLFELVGMDAVVCGQGSIDQAHRPDEFIELAELTRADQFLQRLLVALSR